jgi:hypothetical protein
MTQTAAASFSIVNYIFVVKRHSARIETKYSFFEVYFSLRLRFLEIKEKTSKGKGASKRALTGWLHSYVQLLMFDVRSFVAAGRH